MCNTHETPGDEDEGAAKKFDGPPVHLLNPRPTHHPTFFSLIFFEVSFWAFLGKVITKTPHIFFCKKSMSKAPPKKSTHVSMSVFPRLFRVFLSDGNSSKTLQKTFYKKNRVEKLLQKIRPKPIFSGKRLKTWLKKSRKHRFWIFGRFSFVKLFDTIFCTTFLNSHRWEPPGNAIKQKKSRKTDIEILLICLKFVST
jgi:hypothetical protein